MDGINQIKENMSLNSTGNKHITFLDPEVTMSQIFFFLLNFFFLSQNKLPRKIVQTHVCEIFSLQGENNQ